MLERQDDVFSRNIARCAKNGRLLVEQVEEIFL